MIYWRTHCISVRKPVRWPQSDPMLDHHHIQVHNMLASLVSSSQHKRQSLKCPERETNSVSHLPSSRRAMSTLTGSPPEANEIFGMSCFAIISPVSKPTNDKNLLDTRNVTFVPAFSIFGLSAKACWMRFSQRRFFVVFKPAASQTRLMHSLRKCKNPNQNNCRTASQQPQTYLATCDRMEKSKSFIEVLISKQPMYWNGWAENRKPSSMTPRLALLTRTLNVTPSLVMVLSECDHPLAGLLQNDLLSIPPVAPSIFLGMTAIYRSNEMTWSHLWTLNWLFIEMECIRKLIGRRMNHKWVAKSTDQLSSLVKLSSVGHHDWWKCSSRCKWSKISQSEKSDFIRKIPMEFPDSCFPCKIGPIHKLNAIRLKHASLL